MYNENRLFENISYTVDRISNEEFDSCTFKNCNLSNAALVSCRFNDCIFESCDMSMVDLTESTLNNVSFIDSKLLGVKFNLCNSFIFDVNFKNCILDYSSFSKRKMNNTVFENTSLKNVDFGNASLRKSRFIKTDLDGAIFYNTDVRESDFVSAFNYIINPNENIIKKAHFSKDGLIGLLQQHNIIIE